jgi:NADPH:quinone reductase-like Zn-dependent oxidoreductase
MRAVVVEERGARGVVEDVAEPKAGRGEVLVRVTAAGVNPIDWKITESDERSFPTIVGQDFAGVVVGRGEGVERFARDDRVFGIARDHGAYCEYTVVPEHDQKQPIAVIPTGLGAVDAAALPTAGLTALAAIETLNVANGTSLLILGVTGGVGSFAAQIAQQRGARVIGTAHSRNREFVRMLGTVEMIPYDRENVVDATRVRYPNGVDAVLDLVDDRDHTMAIADAIRSGGAIVSTIGALDVAWFAQRGMTATNLVMSQTPSSSPEGLLDLARLVATGMLRPMVSVEPTLENGPTALEASKTGSIHGKAVLIVDNGTAVTN